MKVYPECQVASEKILQRGIVLESSNLCSRCTLLWFLSQVEMIKLKFPV